MSAYKDKKTGKWYVFFYYRDWQGNNKGKTKRGFTTKSEALEWERNFKQTQSLSLEMKFSEFYEIYEKDIKGRIKQTTWLTKKNIIENRVLPYFKNLKMNNIKTSDVLKWQSMMMDYRDESGKPFSPVYLKTMHNQLSCIFNHAVKYYELKSNPAQKVGNMGKEQNKEMLFWTKEEYLKFSDVMMDKPISFYAFEILYWTGIRVGELLALLPSDIDLENKTLTINKSYQRIGKEDYITSPKTRKSNRTIAIPDFLAEEINEYMNIFYKIGEKDRLFEVTKHYLHHEMTRGSKEAKLKRIRIHDLRHSHISLLINMGFNPVDIAQRVGHENIKITMQYAHFFESKQQDIASKLDIERGF